MKELDMQNGEVQDADHCDHEILDRPGANPVCWKCGEVCPDS